MPALVKQARTTTSHRIPLAAADRGVDALARLKADHRHIEALFTRYESATGSSRKQAIVRNICDELAVHAALEESYFYPVARDALEEDQHLVHKAMVEHSVLKWLSDQLLSEKPESFLYDAKVKMLKDFVIRHIREEEATLFPKVSPRLTYRQEFGEMLADARLDVTTQMTSQGKVA